MIIKGRSRKDGGQLANYLLKENRNQKATLIDVRGTASDDLATILKSWEAEAYGTTRGRKPLYHVAIRLPDNESLSRAQWYQTLDQLERRLKLTEHGRVVVVHNLDGRDHWHAVYSRVSPDGGPLRKMSHDGRIRESLARHMEREFGLRVLENKPQRSDNKARSLENRMAKEAGTSRKALCVVVKAAWDTSRTGREFEERLARIGLSLEPGQRRDYVIRHQGKPYNPVRLLEDVETDAFRVKMQIEPPRCNENAVERTKDGQANTDRSQRMTGKTSDTPRTAATLRTDPNTLVESINRRLSDRSRERDHDV